MSSVIVFQAGDGYSVLSPAPNFDTGEAARKDVPAGTPYLIVDAAVLVEGYVPDFGAPDGHGIGHEAWTAERAAAEEAERLAAEQAAAAATAEDPGT